MKIMFQGLEAADIARREISPLIGKKRKSDLGQFMTPANVARFMASMFPASDITECRLLDAGAGLGSLSCAFLDRWKAGGFGFGHVEATTFEVDDDLREILKSNLSSYNNTSVKVFADDYVKFSTSSLGNLNRFTHAILNPPYKKINSKSEHRLALRSVGIETVNLYSAFLALALTQLAPAGQLVAIIPRSFCNGPYYRPFRNFIFKHAALHQIHIFESRNQAFKDDGVLQENIIMRLERDGKQGKVKISSSRDDTFANLTIHEHDFERIVSSDDEHKFIHIPTSFKRTLIEHSSKITYSLDDLGIQVSTGPVVDFRLKDHLCPMPVEGSVPLLYPGHFNSEGIVWPIVGAKKPNAILQNLDTYKWLYPNDFYCVVRRFSSKEEKRRVVATLIDPSLFPNQTKIGIENHLNVFHQKKNGLPELLARGIVIYLNCSAVDDYFRRFNGHTQVNATDLRCIKYPSREVLIGLGEWSKEQQRVSQYLIDKEVVRLLS